MKRKATLTLMELLVMILVFALCASLCLGVFVKADSLSRETGLKDRAVVLAQTGAETVKGCGGDLEEAAELLSAECSGKTLSLHQEDLTLKITALPGKIPGLGEAEVAVYAAGTEEALFTLTVAWQEVD